MAGAEQRKARDSMKKGAFQLEYSFSKNTIYTKFTPSHLQTIVLTTYLGARDRQRQTPTHPTQTPYFTL